MNKKLKLATLKYVQKATEVSRGQIIGEVSRLNDCERIDIQGAIHILEDEKKIRVYKTYDSSVADTFVITKKGLESLAPWYKKIIYFIKNLILNLLKIKVNIDV